MRTRVHSNIYYMMIVFIAMLRLHGICNIVIWCIWRRKSLRYFYHTYMKKNIRPIIAFSLIVQVYNKKGVLQINIIMQITLQKNLAASCKCRKTFLYNALDDYEKLISFLLLPLLNACFIRLMVYCFSIKMICLRRTN